MAIPIRPRRPARCYWRCVVACVWALTGLGATTTVKAAPKGYLLEPADLPKLLVYPPTDSSVARPVVVMLHGMCDTPENECPRLAEGFTQRAWLACPRGDSPCDGGGATWSYAKRGTLAFEVIDYMRSQFPNQIDERPGHTLAGFSLGALAAVDALQGKRQPFRHLILIGAKVEPAASLLQDAGIRDVVFMAGQWDMMYQHMQRKARTLGRLGLSSRFVDLGPVGHQIPFGITQSLQDAIAWTSS